MSRDRYRATQPATIRTVLVFNDHNWYDCSMSETISHSLLDRVLDPLATCFTPEVARRLVEFRADAETQALVDALADKANEGTLSNREKAEYRQLVEAIDLITVLQAKARTFLDNQNPS